MNKNKVDFRLNPFFHTLVFVLGLCRQRRLVIGALTRATVRWFPILLCAVKYNNTNLFALQNLAPLQTLEMSFLQFIFQYPVSPVNILLFKVILMSLEYFF